MNLAMNVPSATPRTASVRAVKPARILSWLQAGWRDAVAIGLLSWGHGLAIAAFGAIVLWFAHQQFLLLAGAFSGFLVVAPLVATSFYAMSRARELGAPVSVHMLLSVWTGWQRARISEPGSYWCMVRFGLLLMLAGTGWVVTSASMLSLASGQAVHNPMDFVQHVLLARQGWLFESWVVFGAMLAAPMFASSVISMPYMLDRKVCIRQAINRSWEVVLENPLTMALWAVTLAGLTVLGMLPAMLGLVVVMPVLGHASWHAYRDLLDTSGDVARELL